MTLNNRYVPTMPRNILIDLNVIVDVLLEREGVKASTTILELGEVRDFSLYVSAHMVTTFAYLLESAKVPNPQILQHLSWLLETFIIVPVDSTLLKSALKSKVDDFEDAVVERAAISCGASAIITRNGKDFAFSKIPVFSPEEYLQKY
jgi:predicted nucleic acid-binding protein